MAYEAAIRARIEAAKLPLGWRYSTWTVNDGRIYVGVRRQTHAQRLDARSGSALSSADIASPALIWIDAGPLPDPRAFMRGDASEALFKYPRRKA